ncbi:19125_t:CDS:2, partial [Racocetra persica]
LSRNIHENSEQSESDDNDDYDIQDLPFPPFFNAFQHSRPTHEFTLDLSTRYEHSLSSPYSIFKHKIATFMTMLHFEQIKHFMHISDYAVPSLY